MAAIIFLLLGFIPPLVAGPLAGLIFITLLKRGKGWQQIPFWVGVVLVNLLVMLWVVSSSGAWVSIASSAACLFTPAASILTMLVMRIAWRRLAAAGGVEVGRKRWFPVGFVLIPALQIVIFGALIIFAPELCKVGLWVCPRS